MRCRPVSIAGGIALLSITGWLVKAQTAVQTSIVVKGQCTADSHIAEGAIGDDLTKRQSRFFCDSAVITVFGENRFPKHVLVQFAESKSIHDRQIGYGGQMDDKTILNVFNVYLEADRPPSKASDGACKFFYNGDALSSMVCGAKIDEAGRRTVPIVAFNAGQSDTATSPSTSPSQSEPPTAPVASPAEAGDFDRIFEYTLFDQTLPDGKHPVWVYYQSHSGGIVRVDMPSMDMCVVTPGSTTDIGVINSKNYDVVDKSSPDWSLAHDIWKAAFQRYMIVGTPKAC